MTDTHGHKIAFAKTPARTDADGGFSVQLATPELPRTYIVHLVGGQTPAGRNRTPLKALGTRNSLGMYVNELTTAAAYLTQVKHMSVARAVNRTARNLCLPNPGGDPLALGGLGSVRSRLYAPPSVFNQQRTAKMQQWVLKGQRHCFQSKTTPAQFSTSGTNEPITVSGLAGPILADLIANGVWNAIEGTACTDKVKLGACPRTHTI